MMDRGVVSQKGGLVDGEEKRHEKEEKEVKEEEDDGVCCAFCALCCSLAQGSAMAQSAAYSATCMGQGSND